MIVGLDIGGTKIEGVGLDTNSYETLVVHREPTAKNSYSGFLNAMMSVIETVRQHRDIESIGIGCCGSVGDDGLMQGANVSERCSLFTYRLTRPLTVTQE